MQKNYLWYPGCHLRRHWRCFQQALFLTPAAEKTKTHSENSSQKLKEKTQFQGGTFLLSRKKIDLTNFSPETEIFLLVATFNAIFMSKYFKILPISTIFYQKYWFFSENWRKIVGKNIKLKKNSKKTPQNWSKKLKVRETFLNPSIQAITVPST